MQTPPEIRRTSRAPREERRSHRRLGKIAATSILFATAMGSVFGQQQCTRTEVRRVLASVQTAPSETTQNPPQPEAKPIPSPVSRPSARRKPAIIPNSSHPVDPVTAVAVPHEHDLYYVLKECEEKWQEQDRFIAYGCRAYSCTPPNCKENIPGYACWLDSEDRSLEGQRLYLDLDLDREVVTVAWSPQALNGQMIPFPRENFCEDIADQEEQHREDIREIERHLAPFMVGVPITTKGGWTKFSLRKKACARSSKLDIAPDLTMGIFYPIGPEEDPMSFNIASPGEIPSVVGEFLETEKDCGPSITY